MKKLSTLFSKPIHFFFAGVFLVLGVALRLVAIRGDLWLDEVCSLEYAHLIHSPLEVFTRSHEDNIHPLNTLYLYFLGQQQLFSVYRLLSLASGLGTLILAYFIAKPFGRLEAYLALLLF